MHEVLERSSGFWKVGNTCDFEFQEQLQSASLQLAAACNRERVNHWFGADFTVLRVTQ
jgi:hypothetical protein